MNIEEKTSYFCLICDFYLFTTLQLQRTWFIFPHKDRMLSLVARCLTRHFYSCPLLICASFPMVIMESKIIKWTSFYRHCIRAHMHQSNKAYKRTVSSRFSNNIRVCLSGRKLSQSKTGTIWTESEANRASMPILILLIQGPKQLRNWKMQIYRIDLYSGVNK